MKDFNTEFKDKKITVMGLGLLGRAVGDVAYLARCGADITVTDLKKESELTSSLEQLKKYNNITYVLGEHRIEDFKDCDMVLKAAGVPLDSPYIAEAQKHDIPVEMGASLFARLSGIPIIGVTGTRGKSTVTHLIHHVLSESTDGEVLLGGNVRGVSTLSFLERVTEESVAVLELDSWQMQGFGDHHMSPHIAVFTNFMDDHLNYYKGDRDAYFKDKANIFLYQESGDVLVTTPSVFARAEAYAKKEGHTFEQYVVLADASFIPEDWDISMRGEHNIENAALALAALRATGLNNEIIKIGMESFKGVPGRLEYLGEKDGVTIYNDNNATTPDATVAALKAVGEEEQPNIVLIVGGADKGLDMAPLVGEISTYAKSVVLLAGTGTDRIKDSLPGAPVCDTLEVAVDTAFAMAEVGDVILFSPAFASFGMFKNEYDRNDQFVALIRTYG